MFIVYRKDLNINDFFPSHTYPHARPAHKKWRFLVSALWFDGGASEFVDNLTRTQDERYLFSVCIKLWTHFLHIKKCDSFSTCECRHQKNVRPAPVQR